MVISSTLFYTSAHQIYTPLIYPFWAEPLHIVHYQSCALAVPRDLKLLTFVFGQLNKLTFCIKFKWQAPQISAFELPVILLRAQLWLPTPVTREILLWHCLLCCFHQIFFQVLIILTGNYNFFNLLAIALLLSILDDEHLVTILPLSLGEKTNAQL